MKDKLSKLRLTIDGYYHLVEALNPAEESKPAYTDSGLEYSIKNPSDSGVTSMPLYECGKSLLLAKAWAGSFLGYLGSDNPYKNNGTRKELKDIEPTDSIHKVGYPELNDGLEPTYIQKVDWIRERIKDLVTEIGEDDEYHGEVYGEQIYIKLTEARFHLGYELEKIRNESEK